jgi:DNA-binding NarL/FixJ family response regulator
MSAKAERAVRESRESPRIRILIVEDHAIVRAGLRMLLENSPGMEVVGEAPSVSGLFSAPVGLVPDVILLDLDLGHENGADFLPELLKRFSRVRVLVLTAASDPEVHLQAVGAGASGVVIKEQAPEMLLKAIQSVHAGEIWLARSLISSVLGRFSKSRADAKKANSEAAKVELLTPREKDVMALIIEGLNGDRIATQLRISEGTVRNHLTSILAKLELSNRFELAVFAFRHGLGDGRLKDSR